MKRSEINQCIKDMEKLIEKYRFALPPFCRWTPEEWKEKGNIRFVVSNKRLEDMVPKYIWRLRQKTGTNGVQSSDA